MSKLDDIKRGIRDLRNDLRRFRLASPDCKIQCGGTWPFYVLTVATPRLDYPILDEETPSEMGYTLDTQDGSLVLYLRSLTFDPLVKYPDGATCSTLGLLSAHPEVTIAGWTGEVYEWVEGVRGPVITTPVVTVTLNGGATILDLPDLMADGCGVLMFLRRFDVFSATYPIPDESGPCEGLTQYLDQTLNEEGFYNFVLFADYPKADLIANLTEVSPTVYSFTPASMDTGTWMDPGTLEEFPLFDSADYRMPLFDTYQAPGEDLYWIQDEMEEKLGQLDLCWYADAAARTALFTSYGVTPP